MLLKNRIIYEINIQLIYVVIPLPPDFVVIDFSGVHQSLLTSFLARVLVCAINFVEEMEGLCGDGFPQNRIWQVPSLGPGIKIKDLDNWLPLLHKLYISFFELVGVCVATRTLIKTILHCVIFQP